MGPQILPYQDMIL